ncbi:transglycosylase SLT domain-containing protein [Ideonella sp. DXS22W]|uniref:Transglycosylase SLT domain-containing protein n=1 Tax=Pseudaquabacterium inlustre TaxID=2984192 RepID=A0ABU9CM09_9BURK
MPTPHRPRLPRRLATAALCALAWAAGAAQAQVPGIDAALNAGVAALPMVAPRAPAGPVVPATVERWREEAKLLEHGGNGMDRDPARAATLYCQAARHGDAEAQFNLAWMLANDRGVLRDDVAAAHLFAAAAEQGLPQAIQMAKRLGEPRGEPPVCLRPPDSDRALAAADAKPVPPALPNRAAAARVPMSRAAWHPLFDEAPKPIVDFVKIVAPEYQLSPQLVLAIIATESGYNANAQSPKNAMGLMQLIPDTARRFNVRNIMDPAQNIRGGMAYLRWLLAFFEGDVTLAAAAYNAGEGAVVRYRGVPPYAETRAYVRKVVALLGDGSRQPFDARVTEPTPALPLMRSVTGAVHIR